MLSQYQTVFKLLIEPSQDQIELIQCHINLSISECFCTKIGSENLHCAGAYDYTISYSTIRNNVFCCFILIYMLADLRGSTGIIMFEKTSSLAWFRSSFTISKEGKGKLKGVPTRVNVFAN